MDQFIVPQFIDVEDKIMGPITVRQFVLMIAGGLVLVVAYKLFDIPLFIVTLLFIGSIVALFGFYKVNGRPFHLFLISFLQLGTKPRLRVWNKSGDAAVVEDTIELPHKAVPPPRHRMSHARLAELALQVDTGGVYEGEALENPKSQFQIPSNI